MAMPHSSTHSVTRFYDRRKIKTPTELFAADLCRSVGISFAGIFQATEKTPAYIMANNKYGSSFCVVLEGATAEKIAAEYERSNKAWETTEARYRAEGGAQ